MLAAKLLLLLPALSLASVLPAGLKDGVYAVEVRDDGTELHRSLAKRDPFALAEPEAEPSTTELAERDTNVQFWCGCAFPLNPGDTDAAVADLKNQVSGGKFINTNYYSIRGGTVAFICYPFEYYTSGSALTTNFADITAKCGTYISGTVYELSGFQLALVGYMQYVNGLDFCASARSSGQNVC